ncbi:hypothetical protein [uncultured Flavobacterium sp.]|uniref:hypothetical protein n=1 Tax=uncultured Flavobacterium sp. TaxID=165435 RepID=UPI0025EE15B8|nr:hypothetical protein [uncultured Flavobacterium sp.]
MEKIDGCLSRSFGTDCSANTFVVSRGIGILHHKRLERKAGTTFPEKETTIRF